MPESVRVASLPVPTDEVRIERILLLTIGAALSDGLPVMDEDIYKAVEVLSLNETIEFDKDETRRALGRLEMMTLISRDDNGYVSMSSAGALLSHIIATVGIEGGRVRMVAGDDGKVMFEALEHYGEDQSPANEDF